MRRGDRVRRLVVTGGLAAWLAATVAGQHPSRVFHGLRRHDPLGLALPTWRFFAPEPGRHDFAVAYRVVGSDGSEGPWQDATTILDRAPVQAVWFPERRREKALLDACAALQAGRGMRGSDIGTAPAYRILQGCAVRAARAAHPSATSIRFGVLRTAGRDAGEAPVWLLVSGVLHLTTQYRSTDLTTC